MMQDLTGKAALVTGGSRGIGAAVARRLARHGADVAITYARAGQHASAMAAQIESLGSRALAIPADFTTPESAARAVARAAAAFERLDILVNNAGVFPLGPPEEVTQEELERTLAVNVQAAFLASCAALAHLPEGGRIISIGSSLAHRVPYAGVTLYAMSKSALIGLTRGLARDLGPRGITVNLVDPGSTDTDMNPADSEAAQTERPYVALGRYARPEEIAEMVVHLAGSGGSFVSGASILVDGGFNA